MDTKKWGESIAMATGFMVLLGLVCCCLSYKKMWSHGKRDKGGSGSASCTCDAGF